MTRAILILALFCSAFRAYAQEDHEVNEASWEDQLNDNPNKSIDPYQWAENLPILGDSKKALNFCSVEELLALPYLDVFSVNNIRQHIENTGSILSEKELHTIKGLDSTIVEKLLHDFNLKARKTKEEISWSSIINYSRQQIILRAITNFEKRQAYLKPPENGGYLGSSEDYLIRYKIRFRHTLQAAFILQKDAGEAWQNNAQALGFDYFSGHLALRNYGHIEELIIGDFNAEFGQGLALWSSLTLGRSYSAVDIKRYGRGLTPYAGSNENRFYRGVATSLKWDWLKLDLFFSHKKIDALIAQLGDSSFTETLGGNGLYRSESEMAKKDKNTLTSVGGRFEFGGKSIDLGLNYRFESLGIPLARASRLYQLKNFSGQELQNFSLDWNYIYRKFNVFGEVAFDNEKDINFAWGLQSILLDNLRFSYHYRRNGLNYQSLWNAPFSKKGIAGEQGHYLGLEWQINQKLQYQVFYDQYQFHWLIYGESSPSEGFDLQNNFIYQLAYKKEVNLRVNYQQNKSAINLNNKLVDGLNEQFSFRFKLEDHRKRLIETKTIVQIKSIKEALAPSQLGYMIAQDFSHQIFDNSLKLSYRIAFINSPSFASRLYSYERDLYLSFSIPAYYGEGFRFFLLADWKISDFIKIQAKYGLSYFHEAESISSGANEIKGPIRSNLRAQVILKL
jgi:hypothetical protein